MTQVTTRQQFRGTLIGIGAAFLLAGANAVAIEEPKYEVVKAYPDFELRRYAPYLMAETEVSGDFDEVGNKAFRILAAYIFGENRAQEKMEMTAPVNQRPVAEEGEKMAMTAPVTQRPKGGADANTYVLSFVMPSGYTLDTLPEPLNPQVRLREEPAKLMAVSSYSGRWTQANYREHESQLFAAVERAGLTPIGPPVYARYNSPFSPLVPAQERGDGRGRAVAVEAVSCDGPVSIAGGLGLRHAKPASSVVPNLS